MARYSNRANRNTNNNLIEVGNRGIGAKSANVELSVSSVDGDYLCTNTKMYTEKASIVQEIESGSITTLSEFSKTIGALTVHNAEVIVIKNVSEIAAEILITVQDWKNDTTTTDTNNSVDVGGGGATSLRTWSMILPANNFAYLPNSRFCSYSPSVGATYESAANAPAGTVAIEPKDINSGNEYKKAALFAGTAYASGSDVLVDGTISSATSTSLVVDDGDWFKVGDLLIIGNTPSEVVEVEAISGTTLTIKRGMLGSTAANITNNNEINYFFGNENLAFDNGKCMTDQNGNFSQRGAFFGYGRSADNKAEGIVPGSVSIGPFFTRGGNLDWGLQNIKASDNTGLAKSTEYAITVVCDEYNAGGIDSTSTEQIVTFTTDASDVTFAGSSNAVLPKIQAQLNAYFYDASSGLKNKKITIGLHNGDVRVQSHSNHSDTRIGIAKSTSGTTPFDVGRFPTMSSNVPDLLGSPHGGGTTDTIVYGPASSLDLEEIVNPVTGKTTTNTNAFLFDDGNGNLKHNGVNVGTISYVTGHTSFTCPFRNAEFKINAETLSAHAGGANFQVVGGYNTIQGIRGRSMNTKQKSKVEVLLLG